MRPNLHRAEQDAYVPPVIRTDYTDDDVWTQVVVVLMAGGACQIVDDPTFAEATVEGLTALETIGGPKSSSRMRRRCEANTRCSGLYLDETGVLQGRTYKGDIKRSFVPAEATDGGPRPRGACQRRRRPDRRTRPYGLVLGHRREDPAKGRWRGPPDRGPGNRAAGCAGAGWHQPVGPPSPRTR